MTFYILNSACTCRPSTIQYDRGKKAFHCKNCKKIVEFREIDPSCIPDINVCTSLDMFMDMIIKNAEIQAQAALEPAVAAVPSNTELDGKNVEIAQLTEECTNLRKEIQKVKEEKNEVLNNYNAFAGTVKEMHEMLGRLLSSKEDREKEGEKIETLRSMNSELERRNESLSAELGRKSQEIFSVRKENSVLKEKNRQHEIEIKDLNTTISYLKKQNTTMSEVDIREIVKMFLEYVSKVYNASLDKKDRDSLSENIRQHTEYLINIANGKGLRIIRHNRRSKLDNAQVTINKVHTDDESLIGTIKKSDRFGCEFKIGNIDYMPEELTVYVKSEPIAPKQPVKQEEPAKAEEPAKQDELKNDGAPIEPPKEQPVKTEEPAKQEEPAKAEEPKDDGAPIDLPKEQPVKTEEPPLIIESKTEVLDAVEDKEKQEDLPKEPEKKEDVPSEPPREEPPKEQA